MADEEKVTTEEEQEEGIITYPEGSEPDEGHEEDEEALPGDNKGEEPVTEEPEETPRFTLDKPKPKEEPPSDEEEEITEIVHNGQAYRFTKDKLVKLAQKGFDYDFKIGPHGKIVKMIETDPEIAQLVVDHWNKKTSGGGQEPTTPTTFEVKPISDYENESEWLQDNIQKAIEFGRVNTPAPQPVQPVRNTAVSDALKMRDPAHCDMVLAKLPEYAQHLSVVDYQKIDADMGALCQFYDYVKECELKKTKVSTAPQKPNKPSFKVRSGGGEAPRTEGVIGAAWKLNKEDFQKELDKIKGY